MPTLMYGSETWTWNRAQQSKVRAVEMSFLSRVCGVTLEDENNESMYERCSKGSNANEVKCGVVEWLKVNMLRWVILRERKVKIR